MRDEVPNDPNDTNAIHLSQRVQQPDPLPVDIVNALPIKLYEPGISKNINCAICLDDFAPGKSDVRILPCGHGFCVLCIGKMKVFFCVCMRVIHYFVYCRSMANAEIDSVPDLQVGLPTN